MYVHLAGGRVEGALFNTLFTSRQLVRNVEKQSQVDSTNTTINRILLYGNQDKLNSRAELCTFTCTSEDCVFGVTDSCDAKHGWGEKVKIFWRKKALAKSKIVVYTYLKQEIIHQPHTLFIDRFPLTVIFTVALSPVFYLRTVVYYMCN
jgi:hypothetical protein